LNFTQKFFRNYKFKIQFSGKIWNMNAAVPHDRLKPRALYEEVAELLRQRIFKATQGDMEPGAWIDELKLAAEYGISRTPLREAIKVLATEGLVTMKLRRGAYVTEVNDKDLTDVYSLLGLLESDAAGIVAMQASETQLLELTALHNELEACVLPGRVDRQRFFEINERFHMRVLEIADNRWRNQIVADLRKVMKLNRHHSLFKSGRIEESLEEHRAILAALTARDSTYSIKCMQEHFKSGLEAAI